MIEWPNTGHVRFLDALFSSYRWYRKLRGGYWWCSNWGWWQHDLNEGPNEPIYYMDIRLPPYTGQLKYEDYRELHESQD
jgi:hypothetical protein